MPRRPSLSKSEQEKIVKAFEQGLNEDLGDRMEWVEKRVKSFEDWLSTHDGYTDQPWEGASDITPPLIAKAVRSMHARILGSIFNADPLVHVIPTDTKNPDAWESARIREKFLNWEYRNEIEDFFLALSTGLMETLYQGNSFLRVWWDRREESFAEWKILDRFMQDGETERIDQEVLDEIFGAVIEKSRALGDHTYEIDHQEDGWNRTSKVTIDWEDPEVPDDRISVTVEKKDSQAKICLKNISLVDIVAPANSSGTQPGQAYRLAEIYWQHASEVRRLYEQKIWHNLTEEDVDRLEKWSGGHAPVGQEVTEVKEALDEYQGIDFVNGLSGLKEGKVLCIRYYHPWDSNGDGVEEEHVFEWIPALKKLATWDWLSVRYGHRRRPIIPMAFMPLTDRLYSPGLGDLLESLQDEAATIFNQMNNRENLTNNPIMLVEQNAGISPNLFQNLPPGSAIPVRNVERVKALEWQKDPHSGIPVLNLLFGFAEQLSTGDISSGVQPLRPNAPRTARGTLALISEGNILIDTHVLNAQFLTLHELFHQIDGLNRQYMPDERVLYVLGETEPVTLTREDLKERVRFYFSANTVNTNTQVKQGTAQLMYTSLSPNPIFTGQFIQMPPITITALHALTRYFAQEHLPGKDASQIVPDLKQLLEAAKAAQQAQLGGMQEAEQAGQQQAEEQGLMELMAQAGGGGGGQPEGGGMSIGGLP